MKGPKSVLLKSFCLLFIVVSSLSLAMAQKVPVQVMNTADRPVPTVAQGTTAVAGSVSIANTPNVSVANTPNVSVANTPNVSVANTTTNPIPVTVTPDTRRTHWYRYLAYPTTPPYPMNYTVPTGYRVVIEYANIHALEDTYLEPYPGIGQYVPEILMQVHPGGADPEFHLELGPAGHVYTATNRYFAASLPVKVILEPGWMIEVADNTGHGQVYVYLSGYMELAP